MSPVTSPRSAFVVYLCLFSSVAAPEAGAAQVSKTVSVTEAGLEERLDIVLKEADVEEVLASFGAILGQETEIDPEVQGEISIQLHNVRAATALTAVCESVGCLWRLEDGRLKVDRDPKAPPGRSTAPGRAEGPSAALLDQPIDMDLKDADLREALRAFGSIVGARVSISGTLEGKVTIQLASTPVHTALDAVCRVQGCRWELLETEEGPVLRFTPSR